MSDRISAETPDDATAVVTARLGRSSADAFACFTDVAALSTWFWPPRLEPTYAVEPVVGGLLRARSDVGDFGATGTFREIVADERLAMDWQWDGADEVTHVLIEFSADETGSTVTVTHSGNASVSDRDDHVAGWSDCLGRLA